MTWRIRGCPRCGGDTFLDEDMNKVLVENCLQCGHGVELQKVDSKLKEIKLVEKPGALQDFRSREFFC